MARKKKGLPFVVQPRHQPILEQIGTEESGILEIERRGYVSVAEKALVQYAQEDDNSLREMYTLAGRISRESGMSVQEVISAISEQPTPAWLNQWEDEIAAVLVQMVSYQERAAVIQATALLIGRIDSSWTIDQTMELHPDLVADLALLYLDEENRALDAFEKPSEGEKEDDGAEKKA